MVKADARSATSGFDLHTHSSFSDGTDAPADIVREATAAGLAGLALTDHDTTSGWDDAIDAASAAGVTFIPGMEMTARLGRRSIHVLAYLFDPENRALASEVQTIRAVRRERARLMVDRIVADYPFDGSALLENIPNDVSLGRPHIADALVAAGHVRSRAEAFAGILHPSTKYYVPHYAPSPFQAVELIREAGGVAVLAHPAARGARELDDATLSGLCDAGLFGLELGHRENSPVETERLRAFAEERGLAVTGSSDYHGSGKPNRLGENVTSRHVVARIIAETSGFAPINWGR